MSLAEWILIAATPLLLATTRGKRKPPKRTSVRRAKPTPKTRARKTKSAHRAATARKPAARRAATTRKPAARRAQPAKRASRVSPLPARTTAPAPTPATPKPVEPAPPAPPAPPIGRAILLSPSNEKYVDTVHPTFRWLSVGGATRYEIVWSEDPAFSAPHTILSVATEATVPIEESLQAGKTYYWRVRGGNASGWSAWSDTCSFQVLGETP
jgi:hypothetical protein